MKNTKLAPLIKEFYNDSPFESPAITEEQRSQVLELVSKYNTYREHIGVTPKNLVEVANEIGKMVSMAEHFCLSETAEWFDHAVVQRDMKRIKEDAKEFYKVAKAYQSQRDQLNSLYENIGKGLERYFEIADLQSEEPVKIPSERQQLHNDLTPEDNGTNLSRYTQ
jgi:hypothetical protein